MNETRDDTFNGAMTGASSSTTALSDPDSSFRLSSSDVVDATSEEPAKTESTDVSSSPPFYFVWNCVSKRMNLGMIMRSCAAFGCAKILVAGRKKTLQTFGAKGTKKYVTLEYFDSLKHVRDYCVKRGIKLCGVEIMDEAKPVHEHPFEGPTAFLLGTEGAGLSKKEMSYCDSFVYISHYGNGTASLNVSVAASIVFHQFALWAKYVERGREGHKYIIDEYKPVKEATTDSDKRLRAERRERKLAVDAEVNVGGLFGGGDCEARRTDGHW